VKLADFERWRLTLVDDGRGSTATTQRIRKLEREHGPKEKALAETAALLVLKNRNELLPPAHHDPSFERDPLRALAEREKHQPRLAPWAARAPSSFALHNQYRALCAAAFACANLPPCR